MLYKKSFFCKLALVLVLSGSLMLEPSSAFAWGGHGGSGRSHHRRGYFYPSYYAAPIIGGLTFLCCYSLAQRKKETTYVVVPQTTNTVEINIPNSNDSYTVVALRRSGTGYIGPQGEYYPKFPTVEQLKVLYGN